MEPTYTFNNQTINFHIIYKKRKTMGIYIDVYGNIELRLPKNTKDEAIEKMLESKWEWVIAKQSEMKEKTKGFKEKTYHEGEEFLFLGKQYPITIEIDEHVGKASIALQDEQLKMVLSNRDEEVIRKLLTRFYKQQCKKIVESRIKVYQANFKVKPRSIKITSNKKNWGSCNSLRELTFNWKLAMAPMDVIDYVVIHELCHMVHMNHDRSFWRLVGKYMPDYELKQEWLSHSHWKMVV